jgi:hypothetical protein
MTHTLRHLVRKLVYFIVFLGQVCKICRDEATWELPLLVLKEYELLLSQYVKTKKQPGSETSYTVIILY